MNPVGERPVFSGSGAPRPAIGLDGGGIGTWTLRAAWQAGTARRPAANCADTFGVWSAGTNLYAAVASAPSSRPTEAEEEFRQIRFGLQRLLASSQDRPGASAPVLVREADEGFRAAGRSQGRFEFRVSLAVAVFPQVVPAFGRAPGSVAAVGPGVALWRLEPGRAPVALLEPGVDRLRGRENQAVRDGDVLCLATSALAEPPGADRFRTLCSEVPDEADYLRVFRAGAQDAPQRDVAAVTLWSGWYETARP